MKPEIEKLIDYAAADGEVTEAEKKVIYKKANELNVDISELEIVLEAKLYQQQQNLNPDSQESSVNEGEATGLKSLKEELKALENEEDDILESKKTLWIAMHYPKYKRDIENKKAGIITRFPNPRTKTEIRKYLAYAVPKAEILKVFMRPNPDDRKIHNICASAWNNKCVELVVLSRFSFENDKLMLKTIERYAKKLRMESQ